MSVAWIVAYFGLVLQVIAGLVLWRVPLQPRLALRIFAVLFFLNAGVGAILLLPRGDGIWLHSDRGWTTRLFRALDAPTGWFLLALVAARVAVPWRQRAAWALVLVGSLAALAELPFHAFLAGNDHYVRSIPFYAGLGVSVWILAAGAPWERWIALALVPRGLYWGTAGTLELVEKGLPTEPQFLVNIVGLLALAALSLAGAIRLLRSQEAPTLAVAFPVLLVGPAAALVEGMLAHSLAPGEAFRYGTVVMLNFLTLGLVRPLVALLGLARHEFVPAVSRTFAASVLGWAVAVVADPFGSVAAGADERTAANFVVGLLAALVGAAAWEEVAMARRTHAAPAPPAGPGPPGGLAPAPAPPTPERPQWQRILLALQGSALAADAPSRAEPHLTQRAVVERTGIPAPRVSTIARELNASAARRLDRYLPRWGADFPGSPEPQLIQQFEGNVPGQAGVWVYYRLTPVGERLAAALAAGDSPSPAPEPGPSDPMPTQPPPPTLGDAAG